MKVKKLLCYFFVISIFLCFPLSAGAPSSLPSNERGNLTSYVDHMKKQREESLITYEESTEQLVSTVRNYIQKIGKDSKLSATVVVKKCDQYDIDLKLVLAQGHLESQFGTTGVAKMTNSVFNVGALDNGTIVPENIYTHPNYSVEPYIQLLKSQYLVNKTENDLLYGNFVNINGKRYATNRHYEERLIKIISQMDPTIDSLIQVRHYADSIVKRTTDIIDKFEIVEETLLAENL